MRGKSKNKKKRNEREREKEREREREVGHTSINTTDNGKEIVQC